MSDKKEPNEAEKKFIKSQRKLAWVTLTISALIFLFIGTYYLYQEANAQTPTFTQADSSEFFQIVDPEKCERIRIFGERAWVDFRLLIQHPTTDSTLSFISGADKDRESHEVVSDNLGFDFITSEINTWTIGYRVLYPASNPDVPRDIVVELSSEGKPTHKETKKMFGSEICLVYEITTDEPPEFPVIDDLLTDVGIRSLQEMQHLVPAVNTLDQTVGRNSFIMALTIAVVLGLIVYMFFKAKEFGETRIQTQREILNATKNSNEQTEKAKEAVDHIYNILIPKIETKMQNALDKFELDKNSILVDIKNSLGTNKLKEGEKKGDAENIYEDEPNSKEKLVDEVPEILKEEEPEPEPEKEITFADLQDIEKFEEPISLKEKIIKPIKNVVKIPKSLSDKLPDQFKTSQPVFMKRHKDKIQIDFPLDQEVKPVKLRKLYMKNDNKVNESLYRKYWNLCQEYPNVKELRKRTDILNEVLREYAKRFEAERQAEADIYEKNQEKKNDKGT